MKTTTLILAIACLASAGRSRRDTHDKKFTLTQIRNSHFQGIDVPTAMIQSHMKFGKPLTAGLKKAIATNLNLNLKFKMLLEDGDSSTGTAQALPAPSYDSEYVVPVEIGSPPQTIPLNLDTGSSDLWTLSTDTYAPLLNRQTIYRPDNSTTATLLASQSWKIKYGDQSGASGIVYTDRVAIGDTVASRQAVQSAVDVSSALSSDTFSSGILGMASSNANTVRPNRQRTFMDNIRGRLAEPILTANLQSQQAGNYNFGYIDTSEYYGNIQYTAVDLNTPLFRINVSGYQIGSKGQYQNDSWNGIVDTGTSLLLLPSRILKKYYAKIPNNSIDPESGMYVVPCDAHLPDFIFGIESYRGVVPGSYVKYGNVSPTMCYGGLQSSDDIGFAVLGDVLIKAQFVVFDYNNDAPRVGFANKELFV